MRILWHHFTVLFLFLLLLSPFIATASPLLPIHGESLVLVEEIPGKLCFDNITPGSVHIRSTYLNDAENRVDYKEDVDFTVDYEKGTITRTKDSAIPDFSKNVLYGKKSFDHSKFPGYGNAPFFCFVDYETKKGTPLSACNDQRRLLPKTLEKLQKGKPVTIMAYGDSITAGGEASAVALRFQQRWGQDLREHFPNAKITLKNGATGGDSTVQGLQRLQEKVLNESPDLVLIGFGMNDHNRGGLEPGQFEKNLTTIAERIRQNTSAEILLFSTFPPNPDWKFGSHRMHQFASATQRAAHALHCPYVDVYNTWMNVLKRKDFSSLLGNNINHPNNFGHWLYLDAFKAAFPWDTPLPPTALAPTPSPRQRAWHELEYYAFVHFNMNTFTDYEWGEGDESPNAFQPTDLNCRQWAKVCRDAGMKGIILTAKHHDGFCLWPSEYTEHSVKNSSWKKGRGDVLKSLSSACKKYGLKFGVYLSPWDRHEPSYGDSPVYNEHFKNQLREVLTNYGDVFEMWFDGACGEGPNGKKQVYDWPGFIGVVRECQPDAVIFSDAGPDVRWVGNEKGMANPTCWAMLDRDEFYPGSPRYKELTSGHHDGTHWVPAEADVSIRPGWYYHADQDDKVKSLQQLVDIYFGSVGRNASLLLNLPVDRRGLVHENDATRLMELRQYLDTCFSHDLARNASITASNVRSNHEAYAPACMLDGRNDTYWATDDAVITATLEIDLGTPQKIGVIQLEEYIPLGQRIEAFTLEAQIAGEWKTIATETTIGRKRLLRFEEITAQKLRLNITKSKGVPTLRTLAIYAPPPRIKKSM